jgi:uncharacterized membrane protein YdbT with pleckstrin-like domain
MNTKVGGDIQVRMLPPRAVWLFFSGRSVFWIVAWLLLVIFRPFSLSPLLPTIALIFVILPFHYLYSYLWWRNFRYELGSAELHLAYGIIGKAFVTVPYRRIQNIDTTRSLLDRVFGTATLHIQTAGKSGVAGAELTIPGLLARDAESLREEVLNYVHRSSQNSRESSAAGL